MSRRASDKSPCPFWGHATESSCGHSSQERQIITHAVSELINAEHLLKLSILRHREMNEEAESDDGEGPGM